MDQGIHKNIYRGVIINLLNGQYCAIRKQIETWAEAYIANLINCDFELFHDLLR